MPVMMLFHGLAGFGVSILNAGSQGTFQVGACSFLFAERKRDDVLNPRFNLGQTPLLIAESVYPMSEHLLGALKKGSGFTFYFPDSDKRLWIFSRSTQSGLQCLKAFKFHQIRTLEIL